MIHLSRSTAVFTVRLLLSVAVVYRFSHAENKSIFAQRYCPCTPPESTKHTNVRRRRTKYKTIVKDMYYSLIPCGFFTLAPLAEMRYTGSAKTNVKEIALSRGRLWRVPLPSCRFASSHLPQGDGFSGSGKLSYYIRTSMVGLTACALSVTACAVPPLPKGEARALPETFALHLTL